MQISAADRCPVCAMRVAEYENFSSALRLKSGSVFYFCSAGCLLRAWIQPETYLGVSAAKLDRPVVRDYFSGSFLDARKVLWVSGSDVIGPMGPALVPLKNEIDLAAFRRRHGGRVFHLSELNRDSWERLTDKGGNS